MWQYTLRIWCVTWHGQDNLRLCGMWQYTLRIRWVTWYWQEVWGLCGIACSYYGLTISDSLTTKGSISLALLWIWM